LRTDLLGDSKTIEKAFRRCSEIAHHYENFPVASLLIPREKRKYIAAIYAFARSADDIADERGLSREERLDRLDEMGEKLRHARDGIAQEPIFIALAETLSSAQLPVEPFEQLLLAFKMDVEKKRYASWDELLQYCSYSANPIGRIVLRLFGYEGGNRLKQSDAICTALQLTNFWQDLSIDLSNGRIYLPAEDLRTFGCTEAELLSKRAAPKIVDLLEFEIGRTLRLFDEGKALIQSVGNDLRFQLRLTWLAGRRILAKVKEAGGDVLLRRPTIVAPERILLALQSFIQTQV